MKRRIHAIVGSLVLVGLTNTAQAESINISLNLQYTVPSDTTQGGMWAPRRQNEQPEWHRIHSCRHVER